MCVIQTRKELKDTAKCEFDEFDSSTKLKIRKCIVKGGGPITSFVNFKGRKFRKVEKAQEILQLNFPAKVSLWIYSFHQKEITTS